ncbi:hypothetical protein FGG08_006889 [Glutinoglossum americanum]|uniref:Uncharacterized protein n=1 Tax=Glutinoglossum americanum TaxID=1670608 RepID=A0A9P8HVD9_9PEZI|nr:hypothetical protein FGG08_006889 [Glutinoglossum americanum]
MPENNKIPLRRSLLGTHPALYVNEQSASSRLNHCHLDNSFIDERSHRRCHPGHNFVGEESPQGFGLPGWNHQAKSPSRSDYYYPGHNPIDGERSNGLSLLEQGHQAYPPSRSNRCYLDNNLTDEERSRSLSLSGGDCQEHSKQVISHARSASSEQRQTLLLFQDTSLSQNLPLYSPKRDVASADSDYTSPTWGEDSSMLPELSTSDPGAFRTTEYCSALSPIGRSYSSPIGGEIQSELSMQGPSSLLTPYSESSYAVLVDKPQTPVVLEPQDYYDEPLARLADQGSSHGFEAHDIYPGSVTSVTGESTLATSGKGQELYLHASRLG